MKQRRTNGGRSRFGKVSKKRAEASTGEHVGKGKRHFVMRDIQTGSTKMVIVEHRRSSTSSVTPA